MNIWTIAILALAIAWSVYAAMKSRQHLLELSDPTSLASISALRLIDGLPGPIRESLNHEISAGRNLEAIKQLRAHIPIGFREAEDCVHFLKQSSQRA